MSMTITLLKLPFASPFLPPPPSLALTLPPHMTPFLPSKNAPHLRPVLCKIPARDTIIDFGRHKGSMMGTLPSRYLRWIIREMGQGPGSMWAEYAEEVLQDPYYQDRLMWEKMERILIREPRRERDGVGKLDALDSLKAFGWDIEDRDAWSKVSLSHLGTTRGGRIPRRKTVEPNEAPTTKKAGVPLRKTPGVRKVADRLNRASPGAEEGQSLSLREELLRRRALRRERLLATVSKKSPPVQVSKGQSIFPGREALFQRRKNASNEGLDN